MLTRRDFLRTSSAALGFAAGGCVGYYDDFVRFVDDVRCDLRVGVLSDVHIDLQDSCGTLLRTLRFLDARGVDAVVVAGDMTEFGYLNQFRNFAETWNRVFPGDEGHDRRHVERIFVTGNHDWEGWKYNDRGLECLSRGNIARGTANALVADPAKRWRDIFHEEWRPVFRKTVKGYDFIGANYYDEAGVDSYALKPLLNDRRPDGRPFFYVQHLVPQGTCCQRCGWEKAFDNGKITYLLGKHPDCIALCGHSHTPLTDPDCYWRGKFTCLNASSLKYVSLRPGHENGGALPPDAPPRLLSPLAGSRGRHCLVLSVYGSRVVAERWDAANLEPLGDDWDLAGLPEEKPPRFWDDVTVQAIRGRGAAVGGKSGDVITVRFPPVLSKHTGVRAYDYEVEACGVKRVVYSNGCFLGEDRDTEAVKCLFRVEELRPGRVSFSVTPRDAFGNRGPTVRSEEITI